MAIGAILGVAGAIRAGLAYVELDTDDDPLVKGLNRAKARLANWGTAVAAAGAGITAAGVGIVAPIAYLFKEAVERGSTIGDLATQMNSSTEAVSRLAYAFEAAGLKLEEFADVSKTLDMAISQALSGNQELIGVFGQLGLSAQQLSKLPLDERFELLGERLDQVKLGSDRTQTALKLLGGQGQKALRLFANGAEDLKKFTAQANQLGAVLSSDTVEAAKSVSDSFNEIMNAVKFAGLAIGEALLPNAATIKEFAGWVVMVSGRARAWVRENATLVTTLVAVGAGLAGLGLVITSVGVAMTGLSFAIAGVIVVAKLLGATIGFLVSPFGLILVALAGLGYALAQWTTAGQAATAFLKDEFAPAFGILRDTAVDAFGGITEALKAGDFEGAGQVAMAALNVAWVQGVTTLKNIWGSFRDYFMDAWEGVGDWFGRTWARMVAGFKLLYSEMIGYVLTRSAALAGSVGLDDIADKLRGVADTARDASAQSIRDIITGEKERSRAADERREQREADRASERQAGTDAVADARAQLTALIAQQAQARTAAEKTAAKPKAPAPDLDLPSRIARGVFASVGSLAGIFEVGDTAAVRQIRATNEVRDEVKEVGNKLDQLAPRFS